MLTKRILTLSVVFLFCVNALFPQSPLSYSFPETTAKEYQKEADLCYKLIEHQAHYLISITKPWHNNNDYKLSTPSVGNEEHITRPNTGAIAILSFLYRFGNYDAKIVGVDREQLLQEYLIPMIRYVVSVHKTGEKRFDNKKQWGHHWQSAHWTHQLAQGVCTIWKDIPADLQERILKLVRYEADIMAHTNPPFNLKNDSKSEENAWNAGALSAALLLMPDDKAVPQWEKALQRWLLSAYLCPNDRYSTDIVDGKPLKDQYEGANIYNDYTLENHGLAHPDYMTACTLKAEILLDYLANDRKVMDACMYNIDHIYSKLKLLLLPNTGFMYPTGQDWAIFRHADWTNLHAFNLYYYKDREALYWLRENLKVIDRMQQRHEDGRIYAPNENFFPSSQTMCGLALVDTWKLLAKAQPLKAQKPQKKFTQWFDDGRFFIRRNKKAVHSVSWGKRIQFQSMCNAADPIMAPHWNNGIGSIRLTGEKKDLPLSLTAMTVDSLKSAYVFHFKLRHGDAVEATMTVISKDNGDMTISEKLTCLRDIQTSRIQTMSLGILNHKEWIEENGYRDIENHNRKFRMTAMSGKTEMLHGNKLVVDKRLHITTEHPVNGHYYAAKTWNRSKLIDNIVLNDHTQKENWKSGEIINENTMTISYR